MSIEESDISSGSEIFIGGDASTQAQLTHILAGQGYRIRAASEGVIVIREVQKRQPTLIILDIKMPDMNGFEICKALKSDRKIAEIPVLFIGTSTIKQYKNKLLDTVGVDCIVKPFDPEEVIYRVKLHLQFHELNTNFEQAVKTHTKELLFENQKLKRQLNEHKRIAAELFKTRNSLLQEKNRLLAVMEALPAGIAILDADGKNRI